MKTTCCPSGSEVLHADSIYAKDAGLLHCGVLPLGKRRTSGLICTIPLLLLLTGTRLLAQTVILSETFEGFFPAGNGWSVGDANASGVAAYWDDVDSAFGGEGTYAGSWKGYCAGFGYAGASANPGYRDHMRAYMSKSINLSSYSTATLSFWYKIPSIETGVDKLLVYIDDTVIWERASAQVSWTRVSLSLDRFVGRSRTLKFEFYSDGSITAEGAYLDEILVTASTPCDSGNDTPGGRPC